MLICLAVLASCAGGLLISSERPDLALLSLLASIALAIWLMKDIQRGLKNITRFFESTASGDFSTTFDESSKDPMLRKLHAAMNQLIRKFRNLRVKSESREKYYQAVIKQSATGLIVLNSRNEIEVINRAAALFAGISPDSGDTRLLGIRNPHFFDQLASIDPGEKRTYRDQGHGPSSALLLRATGIELSGERLKVVSIENIKRELEQTELESYHRLIRILTHEIMNAVAPLTSVSGTLQKRFFPDQSPIDPSRVDKKMIEGLVQGLTTIDDQTRGMADFVNNYRRLTRLPEPVIAPFGASEWLESLRLLVTQQMDEAGIQMELSSDPGIRNIHADRKLLSQVILNLVNNAKDALSGLPGGRKLRIDLFRIEPAHLYIRVSNNGEQIPEEEMEKIFIPFYTTKEKGSGIGLYVSRQIIHLHGGLLSVSSRPGETAFLIELPDSAV